MMLHDGRTKVWLCTQPTDMRKSFNGLSALVKNTLQENPVSGQCFVFINRRKTQIKLLYFDGSGYCIWMKRLEQGQFHGSHNDVLKASISWTELQMMIDGIEVQKIKKYKRFSRELDRSTQYNPTHENSL